MAPKPAQHDPILTVARGDLAARLKPLVRTALRRLAEMATLEHDWDSYGADPPSAVAVTTASSFLLHVVEQLGELAGERVKPFAVAPFDGGVQLEWRGSQAEVEIDVDSAGELSYVYVDKGLAERHFEEGDGVDWPTAIDLVARVLASASASAAGRGHLRAHCSGGPHAAG